MYWRRKIRTRHQSQEQGIISMRIIMESFAPVQQTQKANGWDQRRLDNFCNEISKEKERIDRY